MKKKSLRCFVITLLILMWIPCYMAFGAMPGQPSNSSQAGEETRKEPSPSSQGNVEPENSKQTFENSNQTDDSDETEPDSDVANQDEEPEGKGEQETSKATVSAPNPRYIAVEPVEKDLLDLDKMNKVVLRMEYDAKQKVWTEIAEEREYLTCDLLAPIDRNELARFRSKGEAKVILTVKYDNEKRAWIEADEASEERQYLPSNFKGLATDDGKQVTSGIIILIVVSVLSLGANGFLIYKHFE